MMDRKEYRRQWYLKNRERLAEKRHAKAVAEGRRPREKLSDEERARRQREYMKKWREAHKDHNRKWREEHREQYRAASLRSSKRYKEAHPERVKESQRRYREAHKEECDAYSKQWRANHPEKVAEYKRRHYQKKKMAALAGVLTQIKEVNNDSDVERGKTSVPTRVLPEKPGPNPGGTEGVARDAQG